MYLKSMDSRASPILRLQYAYRTGQEATSSYIRFSVSFNMFSITGRKNNES